jgi:AraC-like DNA-binding protein
MIRNPVVDALIRLLNPRPLKGHISPGDKLFLERLDRLVAQHQSDPEFTTSDAAAGIGMSRMHLNRKLRAVTGQTTHDYILEKRLDEARHLLPGFLPIETIAQMVGFKSSSHFSTVFRQRFGTTPSSLRARESLARQPTGRKK